MLANFHCQLDAAAAVIANSPAEPVPATGNCNRVLLELSTYFILLTQKINDHLISLSPFLPFALGGWKVKNSMCVFVCDFLGCAPLAPGW